MAIQGRVFFKELEFDHVAIVTLKRQIQTKINKRKIGKKQFKSHDCFNISGIVYQ